MTVQLKQSSLNMVPPARFVIEGDILYYQGVKAAVLLPELWPSRRDEFEADLLLCMGVTPAKGAEIKELEAENRRLEEEVEQAHGERDDLKEALAKLKPRLENMRRDAESNLRMLEV